MDALLAHADWVRGLARSLVADSAAADDLVQDTWAAALQRPPGDGPLRGWLATVLRRLARQGRRDAGRRRRREQQAAKSEAQPATSDVVARAALHGDLVQAVLALHEPYRTVILKRFFDGLPPREIAESEGAPVATVNSRITRGLELLRGRLDVQHGDRRSWLVSVAPLLRGSRLGPVALGATVMNTYFKIGLAACAGLVGLLFLNPWAAPDGNRPETGGREAALPLTVRSSDGELPTAEVASALNQRQALPGEEESEPISSGRTVRGRVLDITGTPLADIAVGWVLDRGETGPEVARSGVDGSFELPDTRPGHVLITVDTEWITVLAGTPWVAGRNEAVLVIAPRIEVAGRVVDEDGRAMAGVALSCQPPFELGADFGRVLDNSLLMDREAFTDDQGRFRLVAPALPSATIQFRFEGFATHVEPLPQQTAGGLQIAMRRVRPAEGSLRGVVVDGWGGVVPGARVSSGALSVRTDRDGSFALDISTQGPEDRVVAVHPGFLPAFAEAQQGPGGETQWPDFLLMQLGSDEPLSIGGRVVDANGEPMSGIKVWLADPTYFGLTDRNVLQVETLVAGGDRFWAYEVTGEDGRFRLDGLLERTYRLGALDPGNLLGIETDPVPAGTSELEIPLPTESVYETLRGRVVTRYGEPVADVRVNLSHITFATRVPGGTTDAFDESEPVRTDGEGRFVLHNVPKERIHLRVTGDAVMPFFLRSADLGDPDDLELVVSVRHHVQVELTGDLAKADSVRLLDENDKAALLRVMRGGGSYTNRVAEIVNGRSQVISVADSAIAVAFYRDGEEVQRLPIRMVFGQVNLVRW
jgi:RNA polymerase sigma-70 factor (ECF subfamily)